MGNPMFASIRKYTQSPTLTDEMLKHQDAIRTLQQGLAGFHAFYLLKTQDGAVSLTVGTERAAVEEANRSESAWLKDKLPALAGRAPEITTGELRIHVMAPSVKAAV